MVDFNSESDSFVILFFHYLESLGVDFETLTPDEFMYYSLMFITAFYRLVSHVSKLLIAHSSSHQDFNTENDGDFSPS